MKNVRKQTQAIIEKQILDAHLSDVSTDVSMPLVRNFVVIARTMHSCSVPLCTLSVSFTAHIPTSICFIICICMYIFGLQSTLRNQPETFDVPFEMDGEDEESKQASKIVTDGKSAPKVKPPVTSSSTSDVPTTGKSVS